MHGLRDKVAKTVFVLFCFLAPAATVQGQPTAGVLFENVRIFNGTIGQLSTPSNVLVVGNVIRTISSAPITDTAGVTVQRIKGSGRTLMPGLIDNHWHTLWVRPTLAQAIEGDVGYLNLLAGVEAEATLMRGFTTVRDLGGPSFGLKRAIDEGVLPGPRIYPSGAMITITGGHGDFRTRSELPRQLGGPLTLMETSTAPWWPIRRTRCGFAYASSSCSGPRRSS
jgi:imidazolonepropionase-like amidohydrolase